MRNDPNDIANITSVTMRDDPNKTKSMIELDKRVKQGTANTSNERATKE